MRITARLRHISNFVKQLLNCPLRGRTNGDPYSFGGISGPGYNGEKRRRGPC